MTQQSTEPVGDIDSLVSEASDAELITAVRGGDDAAFATLWSRHEGAAHRLARQISNPSNADDLVSEAFLRVLRALQGGAGPDGAFRPYLFSALRRINIDNGRSYYSRVSLTEDERDLDVFQSESAADVIVDDAQSGAAWRAWNSLPDSSKTLLWHLIIEEETPAQIAPLIGTTPNGVSSRAVRAKERLRQAFLQQHLLEADNEPCRQARRRFGEYVRDPLSARDQAEVRAHLDTCDRCRAALFEVADINQTMRLIIGPAVLGGLSVAGYVGSGAAGASTGSILHSITHIGHALKNPAVAIVTGVATVAVAGVAIAATFVLQSQHSSTDIPAAAVAPFVTRSSSSPAQIPVVIPPPTPSSIVTATPTPTTPAPTPTPTQSKTTAKAKKTTPTKAAPVPSVALPFASTPIVAGPVASTPIVVVPPPVITVDVTVPQFSGPNLTSPGPNATISFTSSAGWTIVGGTVSYSVQPTCTPSGATTLTCSWSSLPIGQYNFTMDVEATAPAPTSGTLAWSYTDDSGSQDQSGSVSILPG